jgi:hypothetical protein
LTKAQITNSKHRASKSSKLFILYRRQEYDFSTDEDPQEEFSDDDLDGDGVVDDYDEEAYED